MKDDSFTSDDAAHLLCAVLTFLIIAVFTKSNPALRGTLQMIWGVLWLIVLAATLCRKKAEYKESSKAALIMMGGVMCLIFLFRCVSCLAYFEQLCCRFNEQHTVASLIPGLITGIILILFGYKLPIVSQEDL